MVWIMIFFTDCCITSPKKRVPVSGPSTQLSQWDYFRDGSYDQKYSMPVDDVHSLMVGWAIICLLRFTISRKQIT